MGIAQAGGFRGRLDARRVPGEAVAAAAPCTLPSPPLRAAAMPGSAPSFLRRLATPARLAVLREAIRFGAVGVIGLVWDAGMVYALRRPLGLYAAGLVAWLVAATVNWALNRMWTFHRQPRADPLRQWGRYLGANSLGLVLNRGTFSVLVASVPLCRAWPLLPVAAGSLAGMAANFTLSRRLVFR